MLWLENCGTKLLVQLFSEFEIFYCLSSWLRVNDEPTCAVYCRFVYSDRWLSSPKSLSTKPLFFSHGALLFPLTTSLRLNLPFLNPNCCHSLLSNLLEGDRALRSSWHKSLCPVWSRLWPSPSCPKVNSSVCLSIPAVALASHLGVKSPSVTVHFKARGITSWIKT